jgi:hypothetical protein
MAKNYTIPEAVSLMEQYKTNPSDKDLQMEVADLGRRNPLFLANIAAGMYGNLLSRTPEYYTVRKANDALRDYSPQEFRNFIGDTGKGEASDEAGLDTVEDEAEPVAATANSRKKQEQPAVDLSKLLSDDEI